MGIEADGQFGGDNEVDLDYEGQADKRVQDRAAVGLGGFSKEIAEI